MAVRLRPLQHGMLLRIVMWCSCCLARCTLFETVVQERFQLDVEYLQIKDKPLLSVVQTMSTDMQYCIA